MQQPELLFEGKYEILAKIREGGMATIYRVRHRLLDEIRVVKVMQSHVVADADLKRRFLEEAKTAIRLKHPNICTIHDFAADEGGSAYLVMEFIDGVNLSEFLKSRGVPGLPLTLEIAHQALLALGYLHRRGVIHRDIAPDNLMLARDEDGRPIVKLIDLGIAKASSRALDMTATGIFLGKLKYASPEQFGSLAPGEKLDGRSDIYGLGVVLYELLTGIRPYKGVSPAEFLQAHLSASPIPFAESDPAGRVPSELRGLVLRALEKRREKRFATAEDFDREISKVLERFSAPHDVESTVAILSTIRATPSSLSDSVTPSAQDRLNWHFAAQKTPSPSAPPLKIAPPETRASSAAKIPEEQTGSWNSERSTEEALPIQLPTETRRVEPTEIIPVLAADRTSAAAGEKSRLAKPEKVSQRDAAAPPPVAPAVTDAWKLPLETLPTRRPSRTIVLAAVAVAVVAVVALILWRPWAGRSASVEQVAAAPRPAAQPRTAPTAAPIRFPEMAAPAVSPEAASSPAPPPAAGGSAGNEVSQAASAAAAAAQDAEQARAQDFAPNTYKRALERHAFAKKLAAQGNDAEAKKQFDKATELYRQAEAAARPQASRPSSMANLAADFPASVIRPTAPPTPEATAPPVERHVSTPDKIYSTRRGVRFSSSPDQARLFIDGRPVGIVDDWDNRGGGLKFEFDREGPHDVRMELPGYETLHIRINVLPKENGATGSDSVTIDDDLHRKEKIPYEKRPNVYDRTTGEVEFTVDPSDASVSEGGKTLGLVSNFGPGSPLKLDGPTVHDLLISSPGHMPKLVRILVAGNANRDRAKVKETLKAQ